ncbi:MAG: hypothetical protein U0176_00025 [Bacteroidia bacterium]
MNKERRQSLTPTAPGSLHRRLQDLMENKAKTSKNGARWQIGQTGTLEGRSGRLIERTGSFDFFTPVSGRNGTFFQTNVQGLEQAAIAVCWSQ